MREEGCLFCAIVAGEIPADVVAESTSALAFRDIAPQAPTHVIVIPREHHRDVGALALAQPSLVGEVVTLAAQVAADEGLDDGWRLLFNTGRDAGQTVFHVHAHVLGGRALGRLG